VSDGFKKCVLAIQKYCNTLHHLQSAMINSILQAFKNYAH